MWGIGAKLSSRPRYCCKSRRRVIDLVSFLSPSWWVSRKKIGLDTFKLKSGFEIFASLSANGASSDISSSDSSGVFPSLARYLWNSPVEVERKFGSRMQHSRLPINCKILLQGHQHQTLIVLVIAFKSRPQEDFPPFCFHDLPHLEYLW